MSVIVTSLPGAFRLGAGEKRQLYAATIPASGDGVIDLLVAIAGVVALVGFVVLEERRRPEVAVLLTVGLTVLDAVLYPHQGDVPVGPFRPSVLGQDLRLADVIVPAALGARLVVRGLPRRVTGEGLVWTLLFAWYSFAAIVGFVRDQPTDLILFQGKFVLETGGMIALVAGVPLSRLIGARILQRTALVGGVMAGVLVPLALAQISIDVPLLRGAQLGTIAPDAATALFTLGVLVLVPSLCRPDPSGAICLGAGAMIVAPFAADQRAALAGMVPVVIGVAIAMTGRTWRRRSPVRIAAMLPVAALALLPIAIAAAGAASRGEGVAKLPFVERLSETFSSQQKQQSAEARVYLLRAGRDLSASRPVIGQGLGQPALLTPEASAGTPQVIGDFHNIAVDMAVRTGLTGLALLVVAIAVTFVAAVQRWAHLARDVHAGLVLAATTALGGLLVKGLFETIFQKFRLAVLLGFLVGIIAAAASARFETDPTAVRRQPEPLWT
jgi:O-antigen ligase